MQTNTTHSFFKVSSFHSKCNDRFAFSTPATFAESLTANEKRLDFYVAQGVSRSWRMVHRLSF